MATLKQRFDDAVKSARAVTRKAETANRNLTDAERQEVESYLSVAKSLKSSMDANRALNGGSSGRDLLGQFKGAGWAPGKRAEIPFWGKTATFDGSIEDLSPIRREGPPLGVDTRYFFPVFPVVGIGSTVTQVQVLRQKSRSVEPGSGDPFVRDIDSTDPKGEVGTVRELNSVNVRQIAAIESGVSNFILQSATFRSLIDVDLRLAYERALDGLVHDAVVAAMPSQTAAGLDLFDAFAEAQADMAADGYSGNVAVLSPGDAVSFVTQRTPGSEKIPTNRQLSQLGLRVAVSSTVSDGESYLIDTSAAGSLYLGPVALAAFEENAGSTNSQTIRLEGNAVLGLERDEAIRAVIAGS